MHWFLRCPCHTYFHALPKCTGKHSRAITACASAELFSARVIALPACSSKRLCLWLGAMESLGAADLRRCPTAHGASRTVRRAVFAFMKDAGSLRFIHHPIGKDRAFSTCRCFRLTSFRRLPLDLIPNPPLSAPRLAELKGVLGTILDRTGLL